MGADKNNDGVIDKPSYKDFLFLNWMHFCYYLLFLLVDIYIIIEYVLAFVSWVLAGVIIGLTVACRSSKGYLAPRIDSDSEYWDMCASAEHAALGISGFVVGTFISFLLAWHICPCSRMPTPSTTS